MKALFFGLGVILAINNWGGPFDRKNETVQSWQELFQRLKSPGYVFKLESILLKELATYQKVLSAATDEDDIDLLEEQIEILEFLKIKTTEAKELPIGKAKRISQMAQITRLLHGAMNPIVEFDSKELQDEFMSNVVGGSLFGHKTPNVNQRKFEQEIGEKNSQREAYFLYSEDLEQFFSSGSLKKLNPKEISELDVSPFHPAWYQEIERSSWNVDGAAKFRAEMEERITHRLREKSIYKNNESYKLNPDHRVFFLKEVFPAAMAANPKAASEDSQGVDWKLKWGAEVNTEPVANDLYLKLGAKVADMTFALSQDEHTLVLNGEGREEEKSECHSESVETMAKCLKEFYDFDLYPEIVATGKINRQFLTEMSGASRTSILKKYSPERLLGRVWVKFRSLQVELKPKGMWSRFEGSHYSSTLAQMDRVARGLYLFNMWIGNTDAKDDNSRIYMKKEFGELTAYQEAHSDLGLSFGGLFNAGQTQKFRPGASFLKRTLFGRKLRFSFPIMFKPEAWKFATYSDMRWMAKKIASLKKSDIEDSVSRSRWAEKTKEEVVKVLMDRRDRIAKFYRVN